MAYRWLASDLDTKSKYKAYVEQLFTPEQADAYLSLLLEAGSLIEIDGKLAQPDADGGRVMDWAHASATLVQEGKGTKTYRYDVPLFEEKQQVEVRLRYVEGKGWRLDAQVRTIV